MSDILDRASEMYNNTNTAFIFTEGVRRIQKDFTNLRGESQRPINHSVMKVSFLTGRRHKENCAGPRAHPSTLHPLPAPAGIFMSRQEEPALLERKRTSYLIFQLTQVYFTKKNIKYNVNSSCKYFANIEKYCKTIP